MAEFKEVVEKCNDICRRFSECSCECPLQGFDFCPTNDPLIIQKLEDAIMNYDLERKEKNNEQV